MSHLGQRLMYTCITVKSLSVGRSLPKYRTILQIVEMAVQSHSWSKSVPIERSRVND